jgi:hypothetical protein
VIENGIDGVIAYVDGAIAELLSGPCNLTSAGVVGMLQEVRHGLADRPEWSQVVESNLRAELTAAQLEHARYVQQCETAAVIFQQAVDIERAKAERARRVAVKLEQELAHAVSGRA